MNVLTPQVVLHKSHVGSTIPLLQATFCRNLVGILLKIVLKNIIYRLHKVG